MSTGDVSPREIAPEAECCAHRCKFCWEADRILHQSTREKKIPAEWDFSLERLDDAYAIVHRSFGHLRVRGEPLESMGGSKVNMEFDGNSRPGKLLSIGDVLIAENVEISNLDVCRSQACEVCQARWSCDRRNRLTALFAV